MRTTLNIPDTLLLDAKRKALEEGRTVTDLLVEGLRSRIEKNLPVGRLPISTASGGLLPGVDWRLFQSVAPEGEQYR